MGRCVESQHPRDSDARYRERTHPEISAVYKCNRHLVNSQLRKMMRDPAVFITFLSPTPSKLEDGAEPLARIIRESCAFAHNRLRERQRRSCRFRRAAEHLAQD